MATRIYCPVCAWVPKASDRWMCRPGCFHSWNTFDTRGRCPGCAKQWTVTQCLSCHIVSPHEDWYHDESRETETERDRVEVPVEQPVG